MVCCLRFLDAALAGGVPHLLFMFLAGCDFCLGPCSQLWFFLLFGMAFGVLVTVRHSTCDCGGLCGFGMMWWIAVILGGDRLRNL